MGNSQKFLEVWRQRPPMDVQKLCSLVDRIHTLDEQRKKIDKKRFKDYARWKSVKLVQLWRLKPEMDQERMEALFSRRDALLEQRENQLAQLWNLTIGRVKLWRSLVIAVRAIDRT